MCQLKIIVFKKMKKIIIFLLCIFIIPAYADYNPDDSRFSISLSGGKTYSQSGFTSSDTGILDFFVPVYSTSDRYLFSPNTGAAGQLNIDWMGYFGTKGDWSQFYVGGGLQLGLNGNILIVNDIKEGLSKHHPKINTTIGTEGHYGGRLLLGKYWTNAIYTDVSLGLGLTSNSHMYSEIGLRVGVNVLPSISLFVQATVGREWQDSFSNFYGFYPFWGDINSIDAYAKYTTIQAGIQAYL